MFISRIEAWANESQRRTLLGILLIVVAALFICLADATAKILGESYEPIFLVWLRFTGQASISLLILAPALHRILPTRHLFLQIIRSLLIFGATALFFTSYLFMPLADVVAVAQVGPLALVFLSIVFIGEKTGMKGWLGMAVGFAGALVITRPGMGSIGWATALPLAGAFIFAAYNLITRFLTRSDSVWTIFLYTSVVGAVLMTPAVPYFWQTPDPSDLPLLIALAGLGTTSQLTLILAFKLAPAPQLAPYLYISVVWAMVLGIVVFNETPDALAMTGAAMIIGAGLYVRYAGQDSQIVEGKR